jgi:hypothetical protein
MSECLIEFKVSRTDHGTDPFLHQPRQGKIVVPFTVLFHIYKTLWPLPLTPRWWTDICMLHSPAPQIVSRPVTSVTAVWLPSNCKSKITNLILTDSFTNRKICVCLSGCDVCTGQFSGFGFQEISFSLTAVYFTDRAKCKTVLPFTQIQTLDVDFCCHTRCGSLV